MIEQEKKRMQRGKEERKNERGVKVYHKSESE